MKRWGVIVLSVLFLSVKLFSQSISGQLLSVIPVVKDFNNQNVSGDVLLDGQYKGIETDFGVRFNKNQFQLTTTANYFHRFFLDGLKLGGGIKYHLLDQDNLFYENDFLMSARIRYTTDNFFTVEVAHNMIFKVADIVSVRSTSPYLFNFNSEVELLLEYKILENLNAYFNITSFDYFDYPLLGTPFVKLGAEYNFYDRFWAIADFTMKFEDMFTSTTYVSAGYFRIGAKVDIW